MAYDYSGSWDSTAGHQSNLYSSISNPGSTPFSTIKAVEYYRNQGIAPSKLVLGMPLYGRAFACTDGPGMKFSGTGEGSWEKGVWDFKALPQDGAQEQICDEVAASWSYDSKKRLMISYDTAALAKRKADFILNEGLGGAMWWESSADKKGHESLINTVSFLCHTYPKSPKVWCRLFSVLVISTKAKTLSRILNLDLTICGRGFLGNESLS